MTLKTLSKVVAGGALLLVGVAAAQTLDLKPGHPQSYVVQQGDTLWDISARFLSQPWRWKEIWHDNPQVKNPDLIYPGEELTLIYREGKPMLARKGGRPTVKLSPSVREIPIDELAVPTIPIDAIQQFLTDPKVVDADNMAEAPYIVSLGKEHIVGGAGDRVYARGFNGEYTKRYVVYRLGGAFVDPDEGDIVLGHEAIHVADVLLEKAGDPATMVVASATREILKGDRLLAVSEESINSNFYPAAPSQLVEGLIISVGEGVTQVGQHQVVVLNLGTEDGVDTGDVMAVYQAGQTIDDELALEPKIHSASYVELDPELQGGIDGLSIAADRTVRELQRRGLEVIDAFVHPGAKPYQKVTLPEERAGLVMVFRPYEHISYALVMDATRPLYLHDRVRNP